jgi:hypothetical protein
MVCQTGNNRKADAIAVLMENEVDSYNNVLFYLCQ